MGKLIEVARFTENVSETARFYEQLLGESPVRSAAGLVEFENCGVTLRIHATHPTRDGGPSAEDHIAFAVSDLDHAYGEATSHGLTGEVPPQTYPWGRSAYLRDPDGRLVELHESAPHESPADQPL